MRPRRHRPGIEIIAMIPAGSTVSRCGSMSLVEMGLWDKLAQKPGVEIIDPFTPGLSPEEAYARLRQGLLADYLITSSIEVPGIGLRNCGSLPG
jgi:hypothetical protein